MEDNASGTGTGAQTSFAVPKRKTPKWPLFVFGIGIILLGVIISYLVVNRNARVSSASQENSGNIQTTEYKNPNGFAFDYPITLQLVPNEQGVRLAGNADMSFLVKPIEGPLETTVTEIADNFGIEKEGESFEIITINSRTGFQLSYEGKKYHYFPLFGNYYLEIVSDEGSEASETVLNSLEFIAPAAQLR